MDVADELRTSGGLVVPAESLRWSFSRAQGAGGQHVNKTATRVTLDVDIDAVQGPPDALDRLRQTHLRVLRVSSQLSRSQWRNRNDCAARMAELLDDAARPPATPRRRSRPTAGSVERRLGAKRRTAQKKLGRRDTGGTDW
jgi:ribosome-associated protein